MVIGGSGGVGGNVVRRPASDGHDAVAASPAAGVDTITGERLAEVTVGAEVVVAVSNAPVWDDDAVRAFFTTSTRNLLAAERDAGVEHDLAPSPETLRRYVRQLEADEGLRPDLPTSQEREDIRALRKEVYELRRARQDPEGGQRVFRDRARRRPTEVSRLIDEHRGHFGVEPICRVLGVSGVRLLPASHW